MTTTKNAKLNGIDKMIADRKAAALAEAENRRTVAIEDEIMRPLLFDGATTVEDVERMAREYVAAGENMERMAAELDSQSKYRVVYDWTGADGINGQLVMCWEDADHIVCQQLNGDSIDEAEKSIDFVRSSDELLAYNRK